MISSITVYGLTWIILSQAEIIPGDNIGPADAPKFRVSKITFWNFLKFQVSKITFIGYKLPFCTLGTI